MTIHDVSPGLIVGEVLVANFESVVLFLLVDFGWWVTILGMVGDHPKDGD